tara:strand:+ start:1468 stop:3348 length:1881 start_codon:yes stop_codon:yes gene_type:complete
MIEKLFSNFTKNNFFLFVILIFSTVLSLSNNHNTLEIWESLNFFYNFAPLNFPLDFRISPRANIGDPAFFLINLSRILHEILNIEPTINSYRYLSISYGICSLLLFYIINKRFFGPNVSLISTLLLSLNPVFFFYQNTMTVLIISFMVFLFFIERLQKLTIDYTSNISWFTFSIAFSLVLIHYSLGRIFSIILLFFFILNLYNNLKNFHGSAKIFKNIIKNFFLSIFLSFLILIIIDFNNLFSILRFNSLILPYGSEHFFSAFSQVSTMPSLFDTIKINLSIILESLVSITNIYHSKDITNLLSSHRYHLLNPIIFFIIILGFIICISKINKKVFFLLKPNLFSLILLFICLLPLLFSSIFEDYGKLAFTLSTNRMFYLLIPIYLFVSIFINYIFEKFDQKKYLINLLFFIIAVIFLFFSNSQFKNYKNYNTKLLNTDLNNKNISPYSFWKDETKYTPRKLEQTFSHKQIHSEFYRLGKKIINETKKIEDNNRYYIVKVDLKNIPETSTYMNNFHYLSNFNFHSIFLSLYVNSQGGKSAWTQMIDPTIKKQKLIKFTDGNFGAYFENSFPDKSSKKGYKETKKVEGHLRYFSKKIPNIIITTTKEEYNFIKDYLIKKNLIYATLEF